MEAHYERPKAGIRELPAGMGRTVMRCAHGRMLIDPCVFCRKDRLLNPDDYPCPHEPESGCPSCAPDEPCEHHCQSGVDDKPLGDPDKVWRCDECGALL